MYINTTQYTLHTHTKAKKYSKLRFNIGEGKRGDALGGNRREAIERVTNLNIIIFK